MKLFKNFPVDKSTVSWYLFLLASGGLLYFFPESLLLKITLLLVSVFIGVAFSRKLMNEEEVTEENNNIFYLKSRKVTVTMFLYLITPIASFLSLKEYSISFIFILLFVIFGVSFLLSWLSDPEAFKQYLYVDKDFIKDHINGKPILFFGKLKYARLNPDNLVMYEKWAHHKVIFNEFEEPGRIKEVLLKSLKAHDIELRVNQVNQKEVPA